MPGYESNILTIWPQLPFFSSFLVTGYRIATPLLLVVCVCVCVCVVSSCFGRCVLIQTLLWIWFQYIRIRTLKLHVECLHLVHMASVSVFLPCALLSCLDWFHVSTWFCFVYLQLFIVLFCLAMCSFISHLGPAVLVALLLVNLLLWFSSLINLSLVFFYGKFSL